MVNTVFNEAHKMDRGYIRVTKTGPTEAEQQEKLLAAGIAPEHVYVDDTTKSSYSGIDDLKARAAAIEDVRAGGRVVVTDMDRLGASMQDIIVTVGAISLKGAAVLDLSTGDTFEGADVGRLVKVAIEAEARQKRTRMNKARTVLLGREVRRGPKPRLDGAAKLRAREDFDDVTQPIRAVAEKHGISPTQLRRMFGERGTPRGRRPKQEA